MLGLGGGPKNGLKPVRAAVKAVLSRTESMLGAGIDTRAYCTLLVAVIRIQVRIKNRTFSKFTPE